MATYRLIASFMDPRHRNQVIADHLDERRAREYAGNFGFNSKMVENLVNNPSPKFKCITCRETRIHLVKVTEPNQNLKNHE